MALPAVPAVRRPAATGALSRYLVAVVIVSAATLLRLSMDPVIHTQLPYFIYVAAVVVATWFCGVDGGLLTAVVSAFAANYFFVEPRHQFIPHGEDWIAMAMFGAVTGGLVWLVGRWKRAERAVRELHAQTAAGLEQYKDAGEALRQRAEELQAILETVPAPVFVTRDPEARRIEGNTAAARAMGLPLGANLSKSAPEGERPETFRAMRHGKEIAADQLPVQMALAQNAEVRDFEFDVVRRDGTTRTLFGNAVPLRDDKGHVRGSVAAFVDVTERRQMESRLREQADELERASRVKDEFLATLGHELRTPLNAIVGWSSMLLKGGLSAEVTRGACEAIARNAAAQSALIDDVLDVSRIVSGRLRLEAEHVDAMGPIRAAVEAVRPHADAKRITIITSLREGPATVLADAARLQQVFLNLLANAVKFTSAGGRVHVAMDRADSDVRVRVSDSGCGIPPELLPHVFERFRQGDSSSTRTHTGLGLGLAIVRHLVELHGGSVTAESAGVGQGATFTVRLPFHPLEERRREALAVSRHVSPIVGAPADTPALCGVRVLVVDDQADAREMAASVLRHFGAAVEVASSAREALERLETVDPGVLLIDISMPERDGYTLIRDIRARAPRWAATPAIAYTAYAREEDRRQALSSGFQMHIAKPVQADALVRAVADVLSRQ